ncbi:MAG: hypothetical protein J6A59_03570 [Lachnospiraceae bacterium]|nr:hypothetical protein [Lachnospiraceae bacterium]
MSEKHDINLNIHYSAPDEVWRRISEVYEEMPYWAGSNPLPHWSGEEIDLTASVESGGIQITGKMPESIWNDWYDNLKEKLTKKLGYEIGEPEEGFDFKYWEPFVKEYSNIKSIDGKRIVFDDYSAFHFDAFDYCERKIDANPPYFLFKSEKIELRIQFTKAGVFSKNQNNRDFLELQKKLDEIGYRTRDLS